MTEWHMKSKRKPSGGILKTSRRCNKKLAWKGGSFSATGINDEEETRKTISIRGGKTKTILVNAKYANVFDPKQKKVLKGIIEGSKANPANRHFVRRNIVTKGGIISVKIGNEEKFAKITNRPGQEGMVNAVLLEEKEAKEVIGKEEKSQEMTKTRKTGKKGKEKEKPTEKAMKEKQ